MSVRLEKLNDKVIKPLKSTKKKEDNKPIRGYDLFPSSYPNVCLIARKKSGKTVVCQNIIKQCAGANTKVVVFSSTLHKDQAVIDLKKWCKKHNIEFEGFQSMKNKKENILHTFVSKLEDVKEEEDDEEDSLSEEEYVPKRKGEHVEKVRRPKMFDNSEDEEELESEEDYNSEEEENLIPKGKKQLELFKHEAMVQKRLFTTKEKSLEDKDPYISPKYIILLDDLSNELKDPNLIALYKKNRHCKIMTITSTQYVHDLKPESLKQMDYLLLFKGLDHEKLQKIKKDADLSLDFEVLDTVYHNATEQPFSFLYVDRLQEVYRKNFDKIYKISVDNKE